METFTARGLSADPDRVLISRHGDQTAVSRVIHLHDADPESRFTEYRLAAAWFANPPAVSDFDPLTPNALTCAIADVFADRGQSELAAMLRARADDDELYTRFIGPMIDQLGIALNHRGMQS